VAEGYARSRLRSQQGQTLASANGDDESHVVAAVHGQRAAVPRDADAPRFAAQAVMLRLPHRLPERPLVLERTGSDGDGAAGGIGRDRALIHHR